VVVPDAAANLSVVVVDSIKSCLPFKLLQFKEPLVEVKILNVKNRSSFEGRLHIWK
jgi:hypothetical protein